MRQHPATGRRRLLAAGVAAALAAPRSRTLADQGRSFRLGHAAQPGSAVARGIEHAAKVLHDRSGGGLRIEPIRTGGPGGTRAVLDQVSARDLDLALAAPARLAYGARGLSILDAPFVARDFAHLTRMYADGSVRAHFRILEESAPELRAFPPFYRGTRHMQARSRPIRAPEDLRSLRIGIADDGGPMLLAMLHALGAAPQALPLAALRHALRTGALDGQEGELAALYADDFSADRSVLTLTAHVVMSRVPVTSTHRWALLRDAERDLLHAALEEGAGLCARLVQEEEQRLIEQSGGRDPPLMAPDRPAFLRALAPLHRAYGEYWGSGTFERMQAL